MLHNHTDSLEEMEASSKKAKVDSKDRSARYCRCSDFSDIWENTDVSSYLVQV